MTKQSKEKLLKAGYVLIRTRDITAKNGKTAYAIMQCKEFGCWTVLNSYTTKTPRDKQLKMIDGLDNTIVEFE
ncbi:MAG: hypothetical protein LBI45_07345 [Bacteroidales bacterium]|jgi:hypothetical protein|nr:hypothetical protein [Bacteroidales bacterium]